MDMRGIFAAPGGFGASDIVKAVRYALDKTADRFIREVVGGLRFEKRKAFDARVWDLWKVHGYIEVEWRGQGYLCPLRGRLEFRNVDMVEDPRGELRKRMLSLVKSVKGMVELLPQGCMVRMTDIVDGDIDMQNTLVPINGVWKGYRLPLKKGLKLVAGMN